MANAENLINSLTDEEIDMYTISIESNGHIVIDNDRYVCVPDNLKRIAVQYDHNIETVTFDCPRYWDGIDMSTMIIYINYLRADNKLGSAAATNITIDEDDSSIMHFDWVITRNVSEANGPLSFLVCIKMVDSYGEEITHWNSELNKDMYISEGLECSESIAESYPDVITQILATLSGNVGEGALNVTDVIDNLVTNNARKPLSAKQGMILKSLIDEVANEGIDEAQLSNAVETALAEAKANGDFKGEPGKDGTPGKDGEDGRDGISVSHKWEGTKLTVTSSSGTSSADLKGNTGKTAYEYAVDMGYEGSEQDFADKMLREIPMYTSELNNDSGFIKNTELVSDLSVNDLYKALSAFAGWSLSTRLDNTEQNFKDITDDLDKRLSAVADSDDETLNQLSEVVAYIKSNKSLIDSITTSKVNVSDIVDNMTSTAANKPLSANQGRLLRQLIDLTREQKLDATALAGAIETALAEAKASGEFDGTDGSSGKDGKSAFDYAVEGGFTGTENVFAGKLADLANSQWQALRARVAEEYVIKDAVASFKGQNAWLQGVNPLVVSKTYTVRWGGVEYTTTAFLYDGSVVIGNAGIIGGTNTGEPFCISAFENSKSLSLYKESSTEENIAVSVFAGTETVVYNKLPKEYLPDGISAGSESGGDITIVNADWLQNDPDTSDHIKNRTHYKEEVAEAVLFKLQTVNFTTSLTTITGPGSENIIEGELYTVIWNGATHYVTAYNEAGDIMLGDGVNHPFKITAFSTTSALVEKNESTSENVELAIYKGKPKIIYHKLDGRYLPEGYGYIIDESKRDYLVPEMSVEFTTTDTTLRFPFGEAGNTALEAGKTYNVHYNGTDYKDLIAKSVSDDAGTIVYIGNHSLSVVSAEDTGEPFLYYYWAETSQDWLHRCILHRKTALVAETVSFAIYTETDMSEHKRFDARLMPNGLGYLEGEDSVAVTNALTFDGDMTDKANFTLDGVTYFVKITDSPVEISQLYGATVEAYGQQIAITEDICQDMSTQVGVPCYFAGDYVVICYEGGFFMGFDFPKGIYVTNTPNVGYVSSIKALTDCFTIEIKATPHLIDKRLIGDWVARKETQEIEIVPEMEAALSTTTMTAGFNEGEQGHCSLSLDKKYNFTFKGVEYKGLKATEINDGTHLTLQIATSDFNYNYFVSGYDDLDGKCSLTSTSEDDKGAIVTFSIAEAALAPVKMPEEYLPDSLTVIPEIDLTDTDINYSTEEQEVDGNFCAVSQLLLNGSKVKVKYKFAGVSGAAIITDCTGGDLTNWSILHHNWFNPEDKSVYLIYITTWNSENIAVAKVYKVNNETNVDSVILNSSTEGSTKKFKLTVDDSGTISATEVTS